MPVGPMIVSADELVAKMKDARLLLHFPLRRLAVLAQSGRVDETGLARRVHLGAFRAALNQELIQEQTHHHGWFGGPISKIVYELSAKAGGRQRR